MRDWIIEGYQRGGVITISWHMSNPVTYELVGSDPEDPYPGRSWDMTPAVSTILPGGTNHDLYRSWLDDFAQFIQSLTVSGVPWNEEEHLVPVIFRPFHEHNGSVFWWGGRNTTEADYIALWRFTVEYLRDEAGLHNLLYAYSPDARYMRRDISDGRFDDLASFQAQYFYAYPGDEYVDVLGLDNYADPELYRLGAYMNGLDYLVETSHGRSDLKVPALTETGGQRWELPASANWWTNFLYPALIGTRPSGGQVAWVLVWRNAAEGHHSAPYPGHPSAENFAEFKDAPMIHFEDEIPFNLYTWP
jgi:mannan endo-1,4-beta-mannosidase